jgi:hypothetical protein
MAPSKLTESLDSFVLYSLHEDLVDGLLSIKQEEEFTFQPISLQNEQDDLLGIFPEIFPKIELYSGNVCSVC